MGPLDFVALRYAINVCGGPEAFAGLAVTWFDQIPIYGMWDCCNDYQGAHDPRFFTPAGEIIVRRGTDKHQLMHQQQLGERLNLCRPNIVAYPLPLRPDKDELMDLCAGVMKDQLGIPVRMISLGPTERDKVCI